MNRKGSGTYRVRLCWISFVEGRSLYFLTSSEIDIVRLFTSLRNAWRRTKRTESRVCLLFTFSTSVPPVSSTSVVRLMSGCLLTPFYNVNVLMFYYTFLGYSSTSFFDVLILKIVVDTNILLTFFLCVSRSVLYESPLHSSGIRKWGRLEFRVLYETINPFRNGSRQSDVSDPLHRHKRLRVKNPYCFMVYRILFILIHLISFLNSLHSLC